MLFMLNRQQPLRVMKAHTYILFLLVFIMANKATGQSKLRLGVNAGLTYSDIRGYLMADIYNYDFGFSAGVTAEYFLIENLSIKSSLNIERKTFSYTYDDLIDQVDPLYMGPFFRNYDYVTIPILINLEFGRSKNFFVNGGSFFGYLLNAKSKVDGIILEDLNSKISKFDYGLSFGVGTLIPLNDKNNLIIEIRDNLGIINEKTNSINLSLGWNFSL